MLFIYLHNVAQICDKHHIQYINLIHKNRSQSPNFSPCVSKEKEILIHQKKKKLFFFVFFFFIKGKEGVARCHYSCFAN